MKGRNWVDVRMIGDGTFVRLDGEDVSVAVGSKGVLERGWGKLADWALSRRF